MRWRSGRLKAWEPWKKGTVRRRVRKAEEGDGLTGRGNGRRKRTKRGAGLRKEGVW